MSSPPTAAMRSRANKSSLKNGWFQLRGAWRGVCNDGPKVGLRPWLQTRTPRAMPWKPAAASFQVSEAASGGRIMLTTAAFERATARHRRKTDHEAEIKAERLRAMGFTRAHLFLTVMRGIR